MSIRKRLEKSAKTISRFSRLLRESLSSIIPISNANVYFHVIDKNATSYTLEIRNLGTILSEGKIEPTTLEFIALEKDFIAFLKGNISFAEAWVNGKIEVKGVRNNLMQALLLGMVLSS
ncbi:MAG: hypothetical protein ACFFD2_22935 [Promethearchaeota archaeon]